MYMSKASKLLISLIFLSFFAFLYLIITIEKEIPFTPLKPINQKISKTPSINLQKLELDYQKNIKDILLVYLDLINNNSLSQEKIEKLKKELFALKVPPQYRNLHLQLVTAMNKMQEYLKSGDEKTKLAQEDIINDLRHQYQWLR